MRFLLKFSYDGSNYCGYQSQPGLETVQKKLEEALTKINNNKKTTINATGRTDKGVHALCQYGHADLNVNITTKQLKKAMNSNLPADIHIIETKQVDDSFHARYNVSTKEYRYYINLGEYNPLEHKYVFQYNYRLDIDKMNEAIKYYIGTHDYRAFVTENKEKENCTRTIYEASIKEIENDKLEIKFIGNGFLRYQVRNMVGLLIRVGENKIIPSEVQTILLSKDRTKSGKTAPAEGLYLANVTYE